MTETSSERLHALDAVRGFALIAGVIFHATMSFLPAPAGHSIWIIGDSQRSLTLGVLFNLLHTIRGHIEWDPKSAQAMVVQLADLLRRLLNAGERDFSRLADETIQLPPAEDMVDAWVPSLILQPLVENAVVHGLAGHQGPVEVTIAIGKTDDTLMLRVCNTIAPGKQAGSESIGLNNVRERLAVQFEGRARLVAGAAGREWVSEITLPRMRAAPDRRNAPHPASREAA